MEGRGAMILVRCSCHDVNNSSSPHEPLLQPKLVDQSIQEHTGVKNGGHTLKKGRRGREGRDRVRNGEETIDMC